MFRVKIALNIHWDIGPRNSHSQPTKISRIFRCQVLPILVENLGTSSHTHANSSAHLLRPRAMQTPMVPLHCVGNNKKTLHT